MITPRDEPDISPLFSASPQDHVVEVYRALREQAPVLEMPDQRTWLISRYDDVRAIVRDADTWSSVYPERFGEGLGEDIAPSPRVDAVLATGQPWVPTLLFQDGPDHRRHRKALHQALNPTWVRRREGAIAEIVDRLIDRFPADGRIDFVRDFAEPVPVDVFAEAFGVGEADRERFGAWERDIANMGTSGDEDEEVRIAEQYVAFQRFVTVQIEARRGSLADDLLTGLANAQERTGATVSMPELLSIGIVLLAAGSDTTTGALASLVHRMAQDPALMATLRAQPELIPAAVEETLRLDSPVQMFQRKAVRDVELRGRSIRRGDLAMVLYGSANRDPDRFDDPDVFRLDRPNRTDHLAFSQGPHTCAGAMLARSELRIAVELLLARVARIDPDPEAPAAEYEPELRTRVLRTLPLRISPPLPAAGLQAARPVT